MAEHIKVYCRLRGFIPEDESLPERTQSAFLTPEGENEAGCFSSFDTDKGECIYQRTATNEDGKKFRFDGLLGKDSTQEMVSESVADNIVKGCLDGFNGAILTYGQTGSGKTYSMRGSESNRSNGGKDAGVIERVFRQLLKAQSTAGREDMTLSLSCVQVYCEMLQDLLEPNNTNLSIKEQPNSKDGPGRVYVHGLTRIPITSVDQALDLLDTSDLNRKQCSTNLNAHSSRSHACYIVHVERKLHKVLSLSLRFM